MFQVLRLRTLLMNKLLFLRNYFLLIFIIHSCNTSVFAKERNCLNYPYPEGIYLKRSLNKQKQFIYTQSVSIKSKNIRKIEFIKKKNNLYAISSLYNHLNLNSPKLKIDGIGTYQIYSCFDSSGTYKVSYGHRLDSLKKLNILQKVKIFLKNKF